MLSLQTISRRGEQLAQALCANAHGFSLHAAVRCGAQQRKELDHVCRYITRPAIANEQLKRNRAGQVVLQLKSPYENCTMHDVIAGFKQRLAALVPHPRLPLIRFHDVLASNAKLRAAIIPSPSAHATAHLANYAHRSLAPKELKRAYSNGSLISTSNTARSVAGA